MLLVIILLTLLTLADIVLALSSIGYLQTISNQIGALSAEGLFQHRTTRKALVQLLNPAEPTPEETALTIIVNGPEFQKIVEESAGARCTANAIDWFGERNDAQA
jgi:hypothetical protein